MKRWNGKREMENLTVDKFLADIWEVCRRHRMAISHEDQQGAFEVEDIGDDDPGVDVNGQWLFGANDRTSNGKNR